jgi:hypothetical protein
MLYDKEAFDHSAGQTPIDVHFSVVIAITNPIKTSCDGFAFDDGYLDGNLFRGVPCRINPPWPKPTSRFKPTRPGAEFNDPSNYDHPPVMQPKL